ncbi:hypothetical protein LUZ60_005635 [Juncus effusus]|nr:hypothetical protein LUZ60_005635 [Juncus effusus]
MINGGGFVVMDWNQKVLFSVDGCRVLGINGELIVRDGDGTAILLITKKGGIVEALNIHNRWKAYMMDYETPSELVFSLQEPKPLLTMINTPVRITLEPNHKNSWDFELVGSFVDRSCTLKDRKGNVLAQVGVKDMMVKKEFYHMVVQQGHDQAFVVGILAILDNINGESTRC